MSGHSKWSTIKRKKGAADAKRGVVFTQVSKDITLAARECGGAPEMNPVLRLAIKKAKIANMPSANIERAINKGIGNLPGVKYENFVYEGYGPGGVAIFLEVLTDNKKRTVADIRHLMSKHGGNLGENGSVAWMFDKRGQIIIHASAGEEDDVFESALDCGAEDFEVEEDIFLIFTDPTELISVKDKLEEKGFSIHSAEVEMVPKNLQKVEKKDVEKILQLMEDLEENEDIKNVFANFDIDKSDLPEN